MGDWAEEKAREFIDQPCRCQDRPEGPASECVWCLAALLREVAEDKSFVGVWGYLDKHKYLDKAEVERLRFEFRRIEEIVAAMLAGEKMYAQVLKVLHEAPRAALAGEATSEWSEGVRARLEGWLAEMATGKFRCPSNEDHEAIQAALGEIERLRQQWDTGVRAGMTATAEQQGRILELQAEVERLRDIIRREAWLEEASAKDIPGPYISYDDYEKANARAERAEAEVERLRVSVKRWEDEEVHKASCCVDNQARAERAEAALRELEREVTAEHQTYKGCPGWQSVALHVCGGDEKVCYARCPEEGQEDCRLCSCIEKARAALGQGK